MLQMTECLKLMDDLRRSIDIFIDNPDDLSKSEVVKSLDAIIKVGAEIDALLEERLKP